MPTWAGAKLLGLVFKFGRLVMVMVTEEGGTEDLLCWV